MISNVRQMLSASAQQSRVGQDRREKSSFLMDFVAKHDPDKAAELQKLQDEADRLSEMMDARREAMKAQREELERSKKEAARAEVERIKKELQMLQMLALTNPKAAARRAAQLARELKAAVAAYKAAGAGSSAEAGTVSSSPSETTGSSETKTVSESTRQGTETAVGEGDVAKDDSQAQVKETVLKTFEERNEEFSKRKEDADFAAEVRKAIQLIKSVLATAKRMQSSSEDDDFDQTEKMLKGVENELDDISENVTVITNSINVSI